MDISDRLEAIVREHFTLVNSVANRAQLTGSSTALDADLTEDLRQVIEQWLQTKLREIAEETLLEMLAFAEENDPDSLLTRFMRDSKPKVNEAPDLKPVADESIEIEDAQENACLHHPPAQGGGMGTVDVRRLQKFLRQHGYTRNQSKNGAMVFTNGRHNVSLPRGSGDFDTKRLHLLRKELSRELGGEVSVLRGHLVLLKKVETGE